LNLKINYFWPLFHALEATQIVRNKTPTDTAIPVALWKKDGCVVVVVSAIFLIFKD
jgi:hypothetical protein